MAADGVHENEAPALVLDAPPATPPEKTAEDSIQSIDLERGEPRDAAQVACDATDEIDHNDHHVVPPQQQHPWRERLKEWNKLFFGHGLGFPLILPMLVPLVVFAQNKIFNAGKCQERQTECGFIGNEDAYGLGIRLGIYLQWASWFLITHLLPREERTIMSTMSVFVAALLIAILVLTFGDNCTYSVEIIVMIFIIVPSILLNALTKTYEGITAVEQEDNEQEDNEQEDNEQEEQSREELPEQLSTTHPRRIDSFLVSSDLSRGMYGWEAAINLVEGFSTAYAAWFWIRMTVGTDETFAQTPCGTSFFFVARVHGAGIRVIGGIISAYALLALVASPLEWTLKKFVSKSLCAWIMLPLYLFIAIPLSLPGFIAWLVGSACILLFRRNEEDTAESSFSFRDNGEKLALGFMGPVVVICCIIGIELTLHWNNVSHVYSISSTGQLIPLCAGLFNFLPITWKLMRRKIGSKKDWAS